MVGIMPLVKSIFTLYPFLLLLLCRVSISAPLGEEKRAAAVPSYVTSYGKYAPDSVEAPRVLFYHATVVCFLLAAGYFGITSSPIYLGWLTLC